MSFTIPSGILQTAINNAKQNDTVYTPDSSGSISSPAATSAGNSSTNVQNSGSQTTAPSVDVSSAVSDAANSINTSPIATQKASTLSSPTQWNITDDQTVQGQLKGILNSNSPLLQQAQTQAKQQAAASGLLNSSMAATAGESAMINNALPIAQTDAGTYSKAAGYNADEQNQFAVQNSNIQQFNAQQANNAALQGQQLQAQVGLAALDSRTKTALANLDAASKSQIEQIDANYKTLMQTDASVSDYYKQVSQSIATIMDSANMDANTKQVSVQNQLNLLKNGMSVLGAVSNLNLGDLVNFSVSNTTFKNGSGAAVK